MATLKRKLSGGGWSTEALPSEFPIKVPFEVRDVPVQTYSGSFTTDANGDATVNCGFAPDIVIIEGPSATDAPVGPYKNFGCCPLYLNAGSDGTGCIIWDPISSDPDEVVMWKSNNGFMLNAVTYTVNWNIHPLANTTLSYTAIKWTA